MVIKSISYDQHEILQNIVDLHTGPIQADVTFGSGCFYGKYRYRRSEGENIFIEGEIPRPPFCFDLVPRKPGVIAADVRHLPVKSGVLKCVAFDPPFMARTGPGATLKARFGEIVGTIRDLQDFYTYAMIEIHRVLVPGGWLIFKLQDGVLSGVNNFTHAVMYNRAEYIGFKPVDLFVLLAKFRMMHPKQPVQKHARKFHSYFWVFKKRG